jgi:hypothetical protein
MGRNRAINLKDELLDMRISAESILNYLLNDHMSGMEAFQAMEDAMEEFFPSDQDEDEEEFEYEGDIDDLQNNS